MSMTVQEALTRTIEHREIFHDEMLDLMRQMMSGQISPVMIAAIIVGLRVKKETIGEITAAAQVMLEPVSFCSVDRMQGVDAGQDVQVMARESHQLTPMQSRSRIRPSRIRVLIVPRAVPSSPATCG